MRILRKFVVELILVGTLVGWYVLRFPETIDPLIPWIAWMILAHLTWEVALERESLKFRVGGAVQRRKTRMIWFIAFVLGGLISVAYLWLAQRGVKKLTEVARSKQPETQSQPKEKYDIPKMKELYAKLYQENTTIQNAYTDYFAASIQLAVNWNDNENPTLTPDHRKELMDRIWKQTDLVDERRRSTFTSEQDLAAILGEIKMAFPHTDELDVLLERARRKPEYTMSPLGRKEWNSPAEFKKWLNHEGPKVTDVIQMQLARPINDLLNYMDSVISPVPARAKLIPVEEQRAIIKGLLVEYASNHPDEHDALLNGNIPIPADWINERLRQEGYSFSAIGYRQEPDPSKPPVLIENNGGIISDLTVKGGAVTNNAGGILTGVVVDAQEWLDYLLKHAENRQEIDNAVKMKREQLNKHNKNLPAAERLRRDSEFHEIERKINAVEDDSEKLKMLLRQWLKDDESASPLPRPPK